MKQENRCGKDRNSRANHPKLPNGFGTIRYLGPGRRFPYAVHPPDHTATSRRGPAICYVMDWYTGLAVLACWNAGLYQQGMEQTIDRRIVKSAVSYDRPGGEKGCDEADAGASRTIKEVWERFHEWKFGENAVRNLAEATEENALTVSKKLSAIWDRNMDDLTIEDLQSVVSSSGSNITIVSKTLQMIRELYKYAVPRGYCSRDVSQYVVMPDTEPAEHYEPFTDEELKILWRRQEDPVVCMILIMCYSGFRIGAWRGMRTELEQGYFQGGIKTDSGKNRIVPIHSAIRPLVENMLQTHGGYLLGRSASWFRKLMKRKLVELGIDDEERRHPPHSARHTFSRLCESYGVREADRKRMMGHSFGNDITNGVYGHRTVEELRGEIEKIRKPLAGQPDGTGQAGV